MAGENSIGAVLQIDEAFLNNLKTADDRIKQLEESSKKTRATIEAEFKLMGKAVTDGFTTPLSEALASIVQIDKKALKRISEMIQETLKGGGGKNEAKKDVEDIGNAAKNAVGGITQANAALNSFRQSGKQGSSPFGQPFGNGEDMSHTLGNMKELLRLARSMRDGLDLGTDKGVRGFAQMTELISHLRGQIGMLSKDTTSYNAAMSAVSNAKDPKSMAEAVRLLRQAQNTLNGDSEDYREKLVKINAELIRMKGLLKDERMKTDNSLGYQKGEDKAAQNAQLEKEWLDAKDAHIKKSNEAQARAEGERLKHNENLRNAVLDAEMRRAKAEVKEREKAAREEERAETEAAKRIANVKIAEQKRADDARKASEKRNSESVGFLREDSSNPTLAAMRKFYQEQKKEHEKAAREEERVNRKSDADTGRDLSNKIKIEAELRRLIELYRQLQVEKQRSDTNKTPVGSVFLKQIDDVQREIDRLNNRNTADNRRQENFARQTFNARLKATEAYARQEISIQRNLNNDAERERKKHEAEAERSRKAANKRAEAEQRRNAEQMKRINNQNIKFGARRYYANADNALEYANKAQSLNEYKKAIEYLTNARNRINAKDETGQKTITSLNAKIKELRSNIESIENGAKKVKGAWDGLLNTSRQLARQFALIFSVSQMESYITRIAEVRGEMELQQVSLRAILQNKTKADDVFNKTMQLATKSPFRVGQLVTYAKQLAAYRVESDKLFDTTKRLADVSAGLGVDMQRIILAYGQVKAAAFLRATEVRQFTEAGINLYGELQKYFEEVKGESYTTAQIVDMITRKKVTFEDIENIFKRLTSAGGIFYNMQELQTNTLHGKIEKLKDQIYLMQNAIGKNTEGLLKWGVDALGTVIGNWEVFLNVAKAFVPILAALTIQHKLNTAAVLINSVAYIKWIEGSGIFMKIIGAMGLGLGKLAGAFKAAAVAMKTAWPVAVVATVIGLMTSLIKLYKDYNNAINESANNYFKAQIGLQEIDKTARDNIKQALDDLKSVMENEGFELKIPAKLNEEEMRQTFNVYRRIYSNFLEEIRGDEARIASNKTKGWFWDDINEDMSDYTESVGDFLTVGDGMQVAFARAAKEGKNLKEETRDILKDLSKGPKEGEGTLDYYKRMAEEANNFRGQFTFKTGEPFNDIVEFLHNYDLMIGRAKEAQEEAKSIWGEYKEGMTEAQKEELKVRINKESIKEGWSDIAKYLVYDYYHIKVKVDDDNIEQQANWVDSYLKKYFENKTYKFGVKWDKVEDEPQKGFISAGDDAAKSAKKWDELVKRLRKIKDETIEVDDSIRSMVGSEYIFADTISRKTLLEIALENRKAKTDESNALGVDPFEKQNNKATKDAIAERIDLLKKMQSEYEKIRKYASDDVAKTIVNQNFAYAIKQSGISQSIINAYVPTKEGVIKALREIKKAVTDAKKRNDIEQEIAHLQIEIDQEKLKNELDEAKESIKKALDGFKLHIKLVDMGLYGYEVDRIFPGLTKTFEEVRKRILAEYKITPDMLLMNDDTLKEKMGDEKFKAYKSAIDDLNKQQIDNQRSTIEQLLKDYKNKLDSQLQLDVWYMKEREKIANNIPDPILRDEMYHNLKKQYEEKTDKRKWEEFKGGEYYLAVFQNMEYVSKTALTDMKRRLEELRVSLKNLNPSEVKAITEQMEKLDQAISDKSFGNIAASAKEAIDFARKRNELEERRIAIQNQIDTLSSQRDTQGVQVEMAKRNYEFALRLYQTKAKTNPAAQAEIDKSREQLRMEKEKLDAILKELVAKGKISETVAKEIRDGEQSQKKFTANTQKFNAIYRALQSANAAIISEWDQIFGTASDGLKDFFETFQKVEEGFGDIQEGGEQFLTAYDKGDVKGQIEGIAKGIAGTVKTISALFAIGDKKKEREIKKLEENITNLSKAYEKLKKAMDEAWDMSNMQSYFAQSKRNLELQIASREEQIKLEEDKKKKDKEKIKGYSEQIESLRDQLKELNTSYLQGLGGFGSESEFKSAAQQFADAWVDAYGECGDTLDALRNQFNDLIKNVVKKQAMMRFANTFLEPLFKNIDNALVDKNGQIRDANTMADMLGVVVNESGTALSKLDKAWQMFADLLKQKGVDLTSLSNLSSLQQGIQGVTESTAEALESLLNGMRLTLSVQRNDVAAIRSLLESKMDSLMEQHDSPLLNELRIQTSLLRSINNFWSDVTGVANGGKGLRVIGLS